MPRQLRFSVLAILATTLLLSTAQAANNSFINATPNTDYATAGNWSLGNVPTGADRAIIGLDNTRSAVFNTAGSFTTTDDLVLGSGTGSAASGTLTMSGSAGTLTFGRVIFTESTNAGNNGTITQSAGNLTITGSGLIFGGGGAVAGSAGTYNLNGGTLTTAQVFEFATAINSTFNFNGGTLKAGTGAASAFMTGLNTANVQNGGAIIDTNSQSITIGQALLHFAGATTDKLTKNGNGTLTLTGANTYSGGTTVNTGTLSMGSGSAAAPGALVINNGGTVTGAGAGQNNYFAAFTSTTINTGGTLTAVGGATGMNPVTMNGGVLAYGGTPDASFGSWSFHGSGATDIFATASSSITAIGMNSENAAGIKIDVSPAQTLTVTGTFTAPAARPSYGLTKTGTGTLTLDNANTYTGATTVSQGTVQGNNNNSFGNSAATITLGDASTGANNIALGTTASGTSNTISNPITVSSSGSGTVTIFGTSDSSHADVFSNTITLNRATSFSELGGTAARTTITGKVTGSVGTLTIAAGRVTLDNTANDFVGNITINSGAVLQINSGGGVIPDATNVLVNGELHNGAGTNETIAGLTGTGIVRAAQPGGFNFTVGSGNATSTFDGTFITGSSGGNLFKTGNGTLTLTNTGNTFNQPAVINGGTLQLGNGANNANWAAGININAVSANLTFNNGSAQTFGSAISGTGSLTKTGPGTLILSVDNSYGGGTTISQSTLQVGNGGTTGSLGTGAVVDNAALVYNQTSTTVNTAISGTGTVSNTGATGAVTIAKSITLTNNNFTFNSVGGSLSTLADLSVGTGTGGITSTVSVANTANGFSIAGSSSLTASGAGSITISGATTSTAGGFAGLVLSGSNLTTAGTINLNGQNTGEWGINFGSSATIHAASGTTTLTGTATTPSSPKSPFLFINTPTITLTADPGAAIVLKGGTSTGTGDSVFNDFSLNTVFNTTGNVSFVAGATSATNSFWGNSGTLNAGTPNFAVGAASALLLDAGVTGMGNGLKITSMGANSSVTIAGSGTGIMTGTKVLSLITDSLVYDITGTGTLTDSGAISGAGGVTKSGAGMATLSGANTYTGNTLVNVGTLVLTAANDGGTGYRAFLSAPTINNGATLSVNANGFFENMTKDITLSGGTLAASGAFDVNYGQIFLENGVKVFHTGNNQSLISGEVHMRFTHEFNVADGTAPVDLLVTGRLSYEQTHNFGGIQKTGAGVLRLANGADSIGGVALNGGTVNFVAGGLGDPSSPSLKTNFFLADFIGNSTLQWDTGNTQDVSLNGNLRIGTGITATLDTNGNNVTLGTAIAVGGAGAALTKIGSGTLTLTAANTYSGTTDVQAGTLAITAGSYSGAGKLWIGKGAGNTGTMTLSGTAGTLTYQNGTFASGQFNGIVVGAAGGTGTLNVNAGTVTNTAGDLTLATDGGSGSFSGSNGTLNIGGGTLTVGRFIYVDDNSATAVTTLSSGTFNVSGLYDGGNSTGGSMATFNLDGGTFNMGATGTVLGSANVNDLMNFNGGTWRATASHSISGFDTASVKNGGAIFDTNSQNISVSQALLHFASATTDKLTKSGNGTLTLSGLNTYTGNVLVTQGTLSITSGSNGTANGLGANTVGKTVTISAGATLESTVNDSIDYSSVTVNNLAFTIQGTWNNNPANTAGIGFQRTDNLTLQGATVNDRGQTGSSFGGILMNGSVVVSGSAASTYNQLVGGSGLGVLNTTFNVGDVTGDVNADFTVNGVIRNTPVGTGNLTKSGAGTMVLNGLSTFTGNVLVSNGTLVLASGTNFTAGGLGANTVGKTVVVSSGATLETDGASNESLSFGSGAVNNLAFTIQGTWNNNPTNSGAGFERVDNLTLQGATVNDRGQFGGAASFGGILMNGSVIVSGSAASTYNQLSAGVGLGIGTTNFNVADVTGNANADFTVNGVIRDVPPITAFIGVGNLTKSGAGTMVLNGLSTFTGNVLVSQGTLTVASSGISTASGLGANTVGKTVTISSGATLVTDGATNDSIDFGSGTVNNLAFTIQGTWNNNPTNNVLGFERTDNLTLQGATVNDRGQTGGSAQYGGILMNGSVVVSGSAPSIYNQLGGGVGLGIGATNFNVADVTGNASTDFTVNGVIRDVPPITAFIGVGKLTKSGAGTMTLSSGASSYTGATTINAGVLSVGTLANGNSNSNIGASTSAAANLVLGGGTLQYTGGSVAIDRAFTLTAATSSSIDVTTAGANLTISGAGASTSGALTKTGAGTLTLTGANAYSGATTVSQGTLVVGVGGVGSINNSAVTVLSGAMLAGSGSSGAVTINAGATHKPGNSPGIYTVGGIYTENGDLNLEFFGTGAAGTPGGYSQVHVTATGAGSVALGGSSTLTINYTGGSGNFNPTFAQVFTLIDHDGNTSADTTGMFSNYNAEGSNVIIDGKTLKIFYHDGGSPDQNNVVLVATGTATGTLYVNNEWTSPATVNGDLETGSPAAFVGVNAFATPTDLLAAQPAFAGNVVLNGGTYASAALAGGGGVQLQLVNDTVNGQPDVTIAALSGDANDSIATRFHNVAGVGDLTVQSGSFSGQISGGGDLTKTTGATLVLDGTNTYSGVTTISGGTLQIGSGSTTGTLGTGNVVDDAALVFNRSNTYAVANAISGTGTVDQVGSGTTLFSGANTNTYTGVTTVSNGTLELARTGGGNKSIAGDGVAATADLVISGGNVLISASEQIADNARVNLSSGSFMFNGTGLTETIGSFTNTGGVFSTNGANTLIGTGNTITWAGGTNTITSGGLVQDNNWVISGGTNTVQGGPAGTLQVQTGGTGLHFSGTATHGVTLNSDAASPGRILLQNDVFVDNAGLAGTAQILSGGSATVPGTVDMDGGTRTFDVINGTAAVDMLISARLVNGALTKTGAGTLRLTGDNTYTGATTVTTGTLQLVDPGVLQNGSVAVNGGAFQQTGGTNNVTGGAGVGDMVLNGGTYSLSGGALDFHDYDGTVGGGPAWVPNNASTLQMNNGLDFSFTGGSLFDVSLIDTNGTTFTQGGGQLFVGRDESNNSPAQSAAALTELDNNFTQLAGIIELDIFGEDLTPEDCCDAGQNDALLVQGTATLGSTTRLHFVDFDPEFGDIFNLMCADAIVLQPGFGIDGGFFRVVPTGNADHPFALQAIVPEPASVAVWTLVGLAGAAGAWRLRRKNAGGRVKSATKTEII